MKDLGLPGYLALRVGGVAGERSNIRARVKPAWFFDGTFGTSFDVLYRNFTHGSSRVDNCGLGKWQVFTSFIMK